MKRFLALAFAAFLLFSAASALGEAAPAADPNSSALLNSYTPEELLQQWEQIGSLLRANGNYPYVELEKGDTGYEVIALQTRLSALGYYQKEIVDNFGNGTYNAMRDFEKEYKLTVDGIASVSDQQLLFSSVIDATAAQQSTASGGSAQPSRAQQTDAVSGATSE